MVDEAGGPVSSNIDAGTMLKIGVCSSADSFQNFAGPNEAFLSAENGGAVPPGNRIDASFQWQRKWDTAATVFETQTTVYYIGTGSSGQPALFSFSTNCGLSPDCDANGTELVDGVENMQILYGEDTNSELTRDDVANIYRTAADVENPSRVVSIKIGLVIRSPDIGLDIGPNTNFPEFELLDQVTINPPDDANQRFVNNSTLRLRNRGL